MMLRQKKFFSFYIFFLFFVEVFPLSSFLFHNSETHNDDDDKITSNRELDETLFASFNSN